MKIKIPVIASLALLVLSSYVPQVLAFTPTASTSGKINNNLKSTVADNALTRLKSKATKEIDRRVNKLNQALTRINNATKLTSSDKVSLTSQIQAEIGSLTALKTKTQADTDIDTLRTDVKSIITEYRVYRLMIPKILMVIASDRILTATDKINSYIPKLQELISKAETSGKDVTSLNASLADLQTKTADSITQASSAKNAVINLTPDQFNADLNILKGPRTNLNTARTDLMGAVKDARSIFIGTGGKLPASTTESSSSATTP